MRPIVVENQLLQPFHFHYYASANAANELSVTERALFTEILSDSFVRQWAIQETSIYT